jgi:quercetin dioxygenase-like cupin family protein
MTRVLVFAAGLTIGASGAAAVLPQSTAARDAVAVSPQLYTVKLENDRVRVLEYALKPGQSEPLHGHGSFVVRFMGDARIRATPAGGQPTESAVKRGDVAWRGEPAAHAVENVGTTAVEAFIVDVKPCGKEGVPGS